MYNKKSITQRTWLKELQANAFYVEFDWFFFVFDVFYFMNFAEMFFHRSFMFVDEFARSALIFDFHEQMKNAMKIDKNEHVVEISNI